MGVVLMMMVAADGGSMGYIGLILLDFLQPIMSPN